MNITTKLKNHLPEMTLEITPKVIISKKLQFQVNYLHARLKNVEWSGILVYRFLEGTIEDPSNLVLVAEGIHLMDIGSHSFTSYTTDESLGEILENYPDYIMGNYGLGHIHTHHSMATYFSNVDMDELHNNAGGFDFYLSLIANNKEDYCAKIAIETEVEAKVPVKTGLDAYTYLTEVKEKRLVLMDCEIESDGEDEIIDRLIEIEKINKEKVTPISRFHNPAPPTYKHSHNVVSTRSKTFPSLFPEEDLAFWGETKAEQVLFSTSTEDESIMSFEQYTKENKPKFGLTNHRTKPKKKVTDISKLSSMCLKQFICEWVYPNSNYIVPNKDQDMVNLFAYLNNYFSNIEVDTVTDEEDEFYASLVKNFYSLMKRYNIEITAHTAKTLIKAIEDFINKHSKTYLYIVEVYVDALMELKDEINLS